MRKSSIKESIGNWRRGQKAWFQKNLRRLRDQRLWRWLSLGLGAALLAWLIIDFGPRKLARELFAVGPGFLFLPIVYGLGSAWRAFGWRSLLDPVARPSARATLESRFAASVLNETLPLMGVGGEPVRLLWLPRLSRRAGMSALILDRVLVIVADALYLFVVATVAFAGLAMPEALFRNAALALALAVADRVWMLDQAVYSVISPGLILVTFKRGLAVPVVRLVGLFGLRSAERLDKAREVDATVRSLWKRHPTRVLGALGIQVSARLIMSLEIWIGLFLLGARAGALDALIISAVPLAVSVAFAFVPSQLGVAAAAGALVFTALGLDPSLGVALSLLQNLRQLVLAPIGFVCLARAPAVRGREAVERAQITQAARDRGG